MTMLNRIRVYQDEGQLTIEIGPDRDTGRLFQEVLVEFIWIALAIEIWRTLLPVLKGGHWLLAGPYVVVFPMLAAIGLLRLVWISFGREEITLRGGLLSASRRVGVIAASRVYPVEHLRDLHVAALDGRIIMRMWRSYRVVDGRIGFVFNGRMRYIADRTSKSDAKVLVKHFRDWLPKENWTPVLGL
jgi:hypothetical protein